MLSEQARVLYLPNERGTGRQRGPRLALAQLTSAGLVAGVRIFSFLWRLEKESKSETFAALCSALGKFRPNIILVQHPEGTGLGINEWRHLRSIYPSTLIYQEGDAYDLFRKRIPMEVRAAAKTADVSFTAGASNQLAYMRRAGSKDARWLPSTFNPHDFGSKPIPVNRDFDVVMIANESSSKVPLKSIPGSRQRMSLAKQLERRFGSRFAVFGRGWSGPSAHGPVEYLSQEDVVQSGWVTANWDHYPRERSFFSDRLPIALASGTIHVTSTHPGYDSLFGDELGFLHHLGSVEAVVERVESILSRGEDTQLLNYMRQGRLFAQNKFRQDDNLVQLLNAGGAGIDPSLAKEAWQASVPAITEM